MTAKSEATNAARRTNRLRVLFAEDSPRDVKLTTAALERAGYSLVVDVADTPASFQERLEQADYEIILSDYNLRGWTAMDALEIFKKSMKDIPFVVVSGSLGDEAAVDVIKQGAVDYVLKDRMARLPSAVQHALEEKALREGRKRAEEALRSSEERYRLLFEKNPQPMWVFDQETLAFLAVNEAAVQHYGYSREEFLAMTLKDIRPAEDIPELLKEVSKPVTGIDHTGEWRHRKKDGSIINVESTSHTLIFAGRSAELVLVNDITERKRLEEQFRQSQKMEAIGQLAGGVAHDFNNLLTIITGYSQLLLARSEPGDPGKEQLEEIKGAADRAASLTRQLLAFSRRQVLAPQVLDLNTVILNMDKMLRRLIGEDIDLVTAQGKELGRVKADPGQIEQVIMNLVVNARDAMPKGGKLTLETANVNLDDAYARTQVVVKPGPYVMLAVSDTGCGMDAQTQAHIFEPFFTTKEKGKGTGLGLSTVFGIVKQSGGHIWVYSELGRGTTFKIYLPRVEEPLGASAPAKVRAARAKGPEAVLVVEDEAAVRSLVRRLLQENGYTVLEAHNVKEALSVCKNHKGPIDLLLTDIVMPQMNGTQLAKRLVAQHPGMKVLYMSGYTDEAVVHHPVLEPGTPLLQKPFTTETLLSKVCEVLGS